MNTNLYSDRIGFIYVLQNAFMRGKSDLPILKIGATRKHPLSRTKELSAATGVPSDFTIAYYCSFSDAFAAESLIHQHYDDHRVNADREFFELHVDEVIAFIETLGASVAYRDRVEASAYDDQLEENPVTGGEHCRAVETVKTPFAEMFAAFEDRGDGVLNEEERAQCRALERRTL